MEREERESAKEQPAKEHRVEVDLRPGTTVTVPMADGTQVIFDIAKKRGRPVAVVRGATRLRPVTRAKST